MTFEKVAVYEKNLARIHEWIRMVDQKLSIFVALQAALIVVMTPLFLTELSKKHLYASWQLFTVAVVAYILVGCGLLTCLASLYSNLQVKQNGKKQSLTEDQLSLTFFNHIHKMNKDTYKKKMKSMGKKLYEEELLSQIYESARIATKKHHYFNVAIILFVIGMTLSIASLSWLYMI